MKIIIWSRNQFGQFTLFCCSNLDIGLADNSILYRYAVKNEWCMMETVDTLPHIEVS